jgi:hypothetical protein
VKRVSQYGVSPGLELNLYPPNRKYCPLDDDFVRVIIQVRCVSHLILDFVHRHNY